MHKHAPHALIAAPHLVGAVVQHHGQLPGEDEHVARGEEVHEGVKIVGGVVGVGEDVQLVIACIWKAANGDG